MKHFLIKLSYIVLPIWIGTVGWYIYYNQFFSKEFTGDLGNLLQYPFGEEYHDYVYQNIPEELYYSDTDNKDTLSQLNHAVLAVGDSFSRFKKDCYLNYLAAHGINVVSYTSDADLVWLNPFQKAWELMELGVIDSTNVTTFLVETVERSLLLRLKMMDFTTTQVTEDLRKKDETPDSWTLIYPIDYLGKKLGLRSTHIDRLQLNGEFFSHKTLGNELFFFTDDVKSTLSVDMNNDFDSTAINNLKRLYDKAEEKNIRLIIVVPADKYDLYQSFAINNTYPAKTINEDLRRLFPNEENLMLCKELLLPYVQRGEKDIYMLNDTHWSPYTAKIVADKLYQMLL